MTERKQNKLFEYMVKTFDKIIYSAVNRDSNLFWSELFKSYNA